jgi:hypothetical protein
LAAGWFLARALTAGAWEAPRWATFLVELSLGALFGPGMASILYFAMIAAHLANQASVFAMVVALLAASAVLFWRLKGREVAVGAADEPGHAKRPRQAFPWNWALWIGVALGLILFVMDFQTASSANPAGEWDAISIWNVRARYLASGGDLWRRAVSADIGGHIQGSSHPGYPLFLSGFIGLQWMAGGVFDETVSMATSLLFALGTLILLGSSLASRRSAAIGLLAWLVLFASEVFGSQSATQYSDLLQGFAFLAALVLLDAAASLAESDQPAPRLLFAAGLAIGLSCWIKNEGLPFALAALAVGVWKFRSRGIVPLAIGALPGFLALAVLKLAYVQGREDMFPQTMAEFVDKVTGAGRWWQAALGFGKAVYDAGSLWTHPVLLLAVLAFALRFVTSAERRNLPWLAVPVAVTIAAEYGLYLITTINMDWHISTSVSRLLAQVWPSLLWLFFLALREPEEAYPLVADPISSPAASGADGGKRKRR